jgi:hypothetical protein
MQHIEPHQYQFSDLIHRELLAAKLLTQKLSNTSAPELRRYRKFYLSYPGFYHVFLEESNRGTLSHKLKIDKAGGSKKI